MNSEILKILNECLDREKHLSKLRFGCLLISVYTRGNSPFWFDLFSRFPCLFKPVWLLMVDGEDPPSRIRTSLKTFDWMNQLYKYRLRSSVRLSTISSWKYSHHQLRGPELTFIFLYFARTYCARWKSSFIESCAVMPLSVNNATLDFSTTGNRTPQFEMFWLDICGIASCSCDVYRHSNKTFKISIEQCGESSIISQPVCKNHIFDLVIICAFHQGVSEVTLTSWNYMIDEFYGI